MSVRTALLSTRSLATILLASSLAGATSGCTAESEGTPGANTTATNEDVEAPLASVDDLLAGAPDPASIPGDDKADETFPAQYRDLVALQSPVRSQGSRGVCSIFATVALMEHLYIAEGTNRTPDFSEQFLQWSVKNEVGDFTSTEGSNASSNLDAIHEHGIVDEQAWPYEPSPWSASNDPACTGGENLPTRCYTNGEPPEGARAATRRRLPASRWVSSSPRSIQAHMIHDHTAAIVGLTFFYQSWNHRRSTLPTNQDYWRNGYVLPPNDEDRRVSLEHRAGHAIVLVGWDDDLAVQRVDEHGMPMVDPTGQPVMERGFFIFKNSWGTASFGINNPNGPGFGFIAYSYVQEWGSVVASGLPEPQRPPVDPAGEYASTTVIDIPDDAPAGASSTIVVPDAGNVTSVSVTVDITHSYRGDLVVKLVRNGTEAVLLDRLGGTADDVHETFTTDRFAGSDGQGAWNLVVVDTAAQDVGVLRGWSLRLGR